jgi:hypothetical protein
MEKLKIGLKPSSLDDAQFTNHAVLLDREIYALICSQIPRRKAPLKFLRVKKPAFGLLVAQASFHPAIILALWRKYYSQSN